MSTALAIASVSMVLKDLLNNGIIDHDINDTLNVDVKVTALPPDRVDTSLTGEQSQLNLFMYMVTPNAGWRNQGLPSLDAGGDRISNPPLALDLHYLLSAYSPNELHPEILLGYAMQLLFETPVLPRDAIRKSLTPATVGGDGLPPNLRALGDSGLADQVELIKIIPQTLTTEEISKLWTAFQTKYRATTAYIATVVLIESTRSVKTALPVKKRKVLVSPFRQPTISKILSQSAAGAPISDTQKILSGYRLILSGSQLKADGMQVVLDGEPPIYPAIGNISDTQVAFPLPADLPAGMHGAQVVQPVLLGMPPVAHTGVSSNLEAFVLTPLLTAFSAVNVQGTGTAPRSADIQLTVSPAIGASQQVMLFLNEILPPLSTATPLAYSFTVPPVPPQSPPAAPSPNITVSVTDMEAGAYLLRLRVDGAESPLTTDAGGLYNNPQLTIP